MDKEQFNQHLNREKSNASRINQEDAEKGSMTSLPPQLNLQASEQEVKEEPKEELVEEPKEKKIGQEEKERFSIAKETGGDEGSGDSGDAGNSGGDSGNGTGNSNSGKDNKGDNAGKFQIKETAKKQKENTEKPIYEIGGGGSGAGSGAEAGGGDKPGGSGAGSGASGNAPNGLPNEVNNKMESAFNADFSDVTFIRIQTNQKILEPMPIHKVMMCISLRGNFNPSPIKVRS